MAVFWEEAGISVDRQDRRFDLAAIAGRHAGWRIYLISHVQADDAGRGEMCKDRWIFNCDADDANVLFRTYGHEALKEIPNLPALNFFRVRPFKPLQKGEIRFPTRGRPKLFLADI